MRKWTRKSSLMYGIDRLDASWLVSLIRDRERLVKSFAFSIYGGPEAALRAAQAWRDEVLRTHPPLLKQEKAQRARNDNKSGVPGVVCLYKPDGTVERWLAKTQLEPGKILQKSFAVGRYGRQAKALAIAERQRQLAQMTGHVILHPAADPSRVPPPAKARANPPAIHRVEVLRRDNTTGIAGVSCKLGPDGQPRVWVAKTVLPSGQTLRKDFSVARHGDQAQALAIAERQKQLLQRAEFTAPGKSREGRSSRS
jgi:hypothetical protein